MKLKKGDKVYFTKESAPNFKSCSYLTIGKEYKITDCSGGSMRIVMDSGDLIYSSFPTSTHLNGGTWLKVKTKKRKLEKEIENLQRKLETTEQLLKVSRERIDEIIANNKIDKENSTFENIIFKEIEKKLPMSFEDLVQFNGYYIRQSDSDIGYISEAKANSCNSNVWKSEELAKASLALNQLIWLRDEWNEGLVADWENLTNKYCVCFVENRVEVFSLSKSKRVLSFKDVRTAESFANQFESLINEAKPLL
jgi:hypothetical protein